jgi:hypothetical protein
MWLLIACVDAGKDTGPSAEEGCVVGDAPTYDVAFGVTPDPLVAGEAGEVSWTVTDENGCPVEDLQTSHERIGHLLVVSADLTSFQHVHHEDSADLTADDLRAATFHAPVTVPMSGEYLLVLDYAHRNQWLQATGSVMAAGEPAQRGEPLYDDATVAVADDVTVSLAWVVAPVAGFEASWQVTLTTADGDVEDIVQYLGADAHAAVVSADLAWAGHTHAYVPFMETMTPTMTMPHTYDGPDVPFQAVFPQAGPHRMWVQFTRAADPDHVYTAPFSFTVGG